jgi:hypothetical protein
MRKLSKEFLIAEYYRFIEIFDHIPTRDEMNMTEGFPSETAYRAHFGSWGKFLEYVGEYKYVNKLRLTGDEICGYCGTNNPLDHWRSVYGVRVCRSCYNKWYCSLPEKKVLKYSYKTIYKKNPTYQAMVNHYSYKRRRDLGYNPINVPFADSHYHHLHLNGDKDIGIYIPSELHKSVYHNSKTWQGMDEINNIAFNWYFKEYLGVTIKGVIE